MTWIIVNSYGNSFGDRTFVLKNIKTGEERTETFQEGSHSDVEITLDILNNPKKEGSK